MDNRIARRVRRMGLLGCLLWPAAAQAQEHVQAQAANGADTAWILTASAFVLVMTLPALALFYGGLVRARNVLSVFMQCFTITGVASLLWATVGYSLAFAPGSGWIGDLSHFGLANLPDLRAGTTISENTFALFQMTFAIITPALIVGAFVERVKFGWMTAFMLLWSLIVYVPSAHWLWGGGWLAQMGALDFAGGIVVHTTAGISAIVLALMIGKRQGFGHSLILPHSPVLTLTGAGLLWFGWYGFNGGSALGANASAASAILNTHLAACAASLIWIAIERVKLGNSTSIGIATGAIAGLATVTPAAGYIGVMGSITLGLAGGIICYFAVDLIRNHWHIDDSLDVFAVHGIGGMLGSVLLAVFASTALGGKGYAEGMTMGSQLAAQLSAVAFVALWSGVCTFVLAKLVGFVMPMRVTKDEEREGLDVASHSERSWELD